MSPIFSNIDTHADPDGLLRTKGFISVGHDEYWTLDMYNNVLKLVIKEST